MNWQEQEDGRGYATIGRAAWPIGQCTKVEMLQEGSISGVVFQRGDVVWIPTDTLLLYPHRVVHDEVAAPAAPPEVIVLPPPPDLPPELPLEPAPPTKTKRSLFGGKKKEPQ